MSPDRAVRVPTVSSIFRNLYLLVSENAPRSAALLLGCRWSFGLPEHSRRALLTEYALPAGATAYATAIAGRSGLRIVEHTGDEADSLGPHLAAGGAAVVAVDCFHLSHRPAYRRVHSARTLLLRPGRLPGEVVADDAWDPPYAGPVPWAELQRARFSQVPLDPVREPMFAGRPIGGIWFSVEHEPTPVTDPVSWGGSLLRELCAEAMASTSDALGDYGVDALQRLHDECRLVADGPPDLRFTWARQASLVLRAELSSRIFLRALIRAVATWRADAGLLAAVDRYDTTLRALETARDLLVKSLNRPDLPCLPWAATELRAAWLGEWCLIEQVRHSTELPDDRPPTPLPCHAPVGGTR